jgi:endonuclease YncB( thermonuclease family)
VPQCRRIPAFRLPAMVGWREGLVAAAAALWGCAPAAAQQPSLVPPCGGAEIAHGTVSRVIDGHDFLLDDGHQVRLAAVDVPPPDVPIPTGGSDAKATLDALIGGDTVVLRKAETSTDRYGRLVAYVYAERDGDEIFAQGELIAAGFARMGDMVANNACAAELRAREKSAQAGQLGLWANSFYHVLDAGIPADVLAQRGRFALVEGRVVSVRESGATIYVNFGQRWSEGFAVTVLKRNERNFTSSGIDLKGLAGHRVRVRGWVETRGAAGSPAIAVDRPEQIETTGLK